MNDALLSAIRTTAAEVASEGHRIAETIRTTACLHPEASRVEFIAAMVAAGYNADTLRLQFLKSRRIDVEVGGWELAVDGRLVEVVQ